jgi:hypothetical protein
MMASFTAKLGAYDFAQYVRVGPGEGMDPYGAAFEDPVFQDVAGSEGSPLLGIDIKNTEKVWPLYLNAPSKDLLHDLIRDLGREIRYGAQPQRLEWKDKGATDSTFYDVAKARFEPAFSFRQAEHGWFAGNLHIWCQPPYGHTGTQRLVATMSATAAFATCALPSMIGDVGAQMQLTMSAGGRYVGATNRTGGIMTLMSVCPPGWRPADVGAALGADQNATVIGGSGAIGSLMLRAPVPTNGNRFIVNAFTRTPSSHPGRGRVILHLKSDLAPPWNLSLSDFNGGPALASMAIPSAVPGQWELLDLGVVDSDPDTGAAGLYVVQMGATAGTPSRFTYTDAVMFLPEDTTMAVWEAGDSSNWGSPSNWVNGATIVSTYVIDGVAGKTIRRSGHEILGRRAAVIDSKRIGAIPQAVPQASQSLFVGQLGTALDPNSAALSVEVRVRERFVFAR